MRLAQRAIPRIRRNYRPRSWLEFAPAGEKTPCDLRKDQVGLRKDQGSNPTKQRSAVPPKMPYDPNTFVAATLAEVGGPYLKQLRMQASPMSLSKFANTYGIEYTGLSRFEGGKMSKGPTKLTDILVAYSKVIGRSDKALLQEIHALTVAENKRRAKQRALSIRAAKRAQQRVVGPLETKRGRHQSGRDSE